MDSLLFLIPLVACPLSMIAMGAIGWVWARASGRSKKDDGPATTTPKAESGEVAAEGA